VMDRKADEFRHLKMGNMWRGKVGLPRHVGRRGQTG
jgi:hypothetical protein